MILIALHATLKLDGRLELGEDIDNHNKHYAYYFIRFGK